MSTKLQRYRINNCADIADDKGGYCDADDVTELEATNAELFKALENIKLGLAETKPNNGKLFLSGRIYNCLQIAEEALASAKGE